MNLGGTTTGKKPVEHIISKVELSAEIARIALKCPTCRGHVRQAIQKYQNNGSHQGGGHSSLEATNERTDELANEYSSLKYK